MGDLKLGFENQRGTNKPEVGRKSIIRATACESNWDEEAEKSIVQFAEANGTHRLFSNRTKSGGHVGKGVYVLIQTAIITDQQKKKEENVIYEDENGP